MRVLGLETTCDETAAAIVQRGPDGRGEILADEVMSQIARHAPYGGVVPEIAARAHVDILDRLVQRALAKAGLSLRDLDGFAAAGGPGLVGGVMVGLTAAKAFALALDRPLAVVNHLEGHALTPRLTDGIAFPYLLLLVSGGHTQLLSVRGVGRYAKLGTTVDDAIGEAFDKVGKLLGLPYPGGPAVEARAEGGDPERFAFPRPMNGREKPDFSLSGLKTAVRLEVGRLCAAGGGNGRDGSANDAPDPVADGPPDPSLLSDTDVRDLCASFQAAVVDVVVDRTRMALRRFRERDGAPTALVVAGGVAANTAVRRALGRLASESGLRLLAPPLGLCTDNGATIAWAGIERFSLGLADDPARALAAPPRARWPLDEAASPSFGAGRLGPKA